MRKSSFEDTFDRFFHWINWYTDLLVKVTEAKRVIAKPQEKKEIYEAFILKIYVTWDILVEDLIVDCLNRDASNYAKHKAIALPKHLTKNICMCLITGLGFFNVRGISEIERISKNILVHKYNPFVVIPKQDKKRIDEFYKIRNYIAHYSDTSKRTLIAMYKQNYGLIHFQEPGDFLFRRTRFANYINSFNNAGIAMAEFLGV